MVYPFNFEEKIKFTRIRELLKEYCASQMGIEMVDGMSFSSDFGEVTAKLELTSELLCILSQADNLPTIVFADVRDALKKIRVEGLFLEEKELFDLRRSLASIRDLVRFLASKNVDEYPRLKHEAEGVEMHPFIVDRIECHPRQVRENKRSCIARIGPDTVRYPVAYGHGIKKDAGYFAAS
ncbi:MAG: hypothetical protein QM786_13575 [Breznakibacter sp.]